ncbi:MAG TPA: Hsp20 family protein [Candidatus Baltobacteraceae bacterium]|nr:Hsp20 family protein [Candidatus Baltobacteraceae bacterium]
MNPLSSLDRNGNRGSLLARPFADLWGADPFRAFSGPSYGVEIARTETGYTVELPVAGFKPDQIDVTLEDGVLTVAGKNEKRSFTRAFTVPEEVDADRIEANVEHGMLTMTLALQPKAQPKRIQVTAK